jgi:hypothetical protein
MMSVLVAVTADAASGSKPSGQQQQKEASAVVEEFFKYHFGHDMAFNCRNIEDRKQWLSQRLVKALLAECGKPVNPDEAPDIEGDPFTDSEEYPNNFKVEGAEIRGSGYEVTVKLVWPSEERRVRIVLIRSGKTWKIDDVRYEGSGSLNGLVREAARETTEPKGK